MNILRILRQTLHLEDGQQADINTKSPIPEFDESRERELKRRVDALEQLADSLREQRNDSG